jgi:hypothetical protein
MNNPQYPYQLSETYTPDRLVVGLTQLVTKPDGILIAGQNLARGTLVGMITTSGKFTLSLLAASDGSQVPYGILADSYDATAGDTVCAVYVKGEFNQNAVTFGAGQTATNTYAVLRDGGIFLKSVVSA